MGHELDITNGIASFASAREHAWHRLGIVVEEAMTAEEALRAAHLADWNVRKLPLQATQEPLIDEHGVTERAPIDVPDRYATVRTNPVTGCTDYLGVVGGSYTPIQNEDHAELLDTLIGESGAHFETAGALRGGRETFLSLKLPRSLDISGDRTDCYVVALNSHDGSSAFRLLVTPVRVVCANTQAFALKRAKASFSIRHTTNAKSAISEARRALGLVDDYLGQFEELMSSLAVLNIGDAESDRFFHAVAGDEEPGLSTRTQESRRKDYQGMRMLLRDSITIDDAMRWTRYGALNAVTEYVDHVKPVRITRSTAGSTNRAGATEMARALRTIGGDATAIKTRALELALA
jgi:phage/plasmid-like protein (TIGR03299 family)